MGKPVGGVPFKRGGAMKKIFFALILCLFVFSHLRAYAVDNRLPDIRNKISEESNQIRVILRTSNDVVLLISMFDSCLIAISQLDAYFSMLGIMESLKRTSPSEDTYKFFREWLNGIKNTNELNLKTLNEATRIIDVTTKAEVEKLKGYFIALNDLISNELTKFSILDKSAKGK
jgi:hypothetical protein